LFYFGGDFSEISFNERFLEALATPGVTLVPNGAHSFETLRRIEELLLNSSSLTFPKPNLPRP